MWQNALTHVIGTSLPVPIPSSIMAGLPCSLTRGSGLLSVCRLPALPPLPRAGSLPARDPLPESLPPLPLPFPLAGKSLTTTPSAAAWRCSCASFGEMCCSCCLVCSAWADCRLLLSRRLDLAPGVPAGAEEEPPPGLARSGWTSDSLKCAPMVRQGLRAGRLQGETA